MYILLIVTMVFIYLLLFATLLANYIMQSYAQYILAKRRNLNNPWLVWIPVVGVLTTGQLAEDFDRRNGTERKWGNTLLILSIITSATIFFCMFLLMEATISSYFAYGEFWEDALAEILIPFYLFVIPANLAYSALMICRIICFYKILESTLPQKALKYLLLSCMIPFAYGICLLKCRNQGYEIRQQPPASPFPQAETDPLASLEDDDLE